MKNIKESISCTMLLILLLLINSLQLPSKNVTPESLPVIQEIEFSTVVLPPGQAFRLTYNWEAVPMDGNYSVWVHITDKEGITIFQDDHSLPPGITTSDWSGKVSYTRLVRVPDTLDDGTYIVNAGLFDRASRTRKALIPGKGVVPEPEYSYRAGTFKIDSKAEPPPLDSSFPQTLNLEGYRITFRDEFDGPLDVTALGPGSKWIAHTPYGGDFGDAEFTDPDGEFPFSITDGILTIEARKVNEHWRSGLLCSVDTSASGFAQQYGYFEMRAKFPEGPGTWPAFWLLALRKLKDRSDYGFEVDIVEQYGREPNILHTVLHWWPPGRNQHRSIGDKFLVEDMFRDYHTYGFLWDEESMVWYFDGVELWRQPTPEESKTPMYVLIDLALGPGWPLDKTPNPSQMMVDYVRVYAKDQAVKEN